MDLNKKITMTAVYLAVLFFAAQANCQSNKLGTWEVLNAEYYLSNQWNLWGESQLRSQKLYNDFYYHEVKGGINYKLKKDVAFLLGMGQYGTYSNGGDFKSPVISHEFRFWEQLTLSNNIAGLKIEHRYRIEQRWINGHYRNRFRYRLNPVIPLNKPAIENGALYASVFDEVFFTDKAPYFERNRVFAGAGFVISKAFTVQAGWLRQFDYSLSNPGSKKDFLHTTLFFRFHQAANSQPVHPGTMD